MREIDMLIENLTQISGVGNKTANRYAYEILEFSKENLDDLIKSIDSLKRIKKCKKCYNYSINEFCDICLEHRKSDKIIVLAQARDIDKVEKITKNEYNYFVLGGVIDPLNGVDIKTLNIESLDKLIDDMKVQEIILMLPTTSEGELTSSYLKKRFENKNIKISKIAQGVPIGGDLEYLDEMTLLKSIEGRL